MNWIAQAALGAVLGELLLGKRLGKFALLWGALIALLPGYEIVVGWLLNHAHAVMFRHGPFHSLPMAAGISLAIGYLSAFLWKPSAPISQKEAGLIAFAILCAHLLLDCFTAEGASLFWPLSNHHLSFSNLHAKDPLFTAQLLATALGMAWLEVETRKKSRSKKKQPLGKRQRLCQWGLGISGGYAALSILLKFTVSAGFEADLTRRGITYHRRTEAPASRQILLWRAVVESKNEYRVGYRSVFEWFSTPIRWTIYPKNPGALAKLTGLKEATVLTDPADDWWLARPTAKGTWLGDMRRGEFRTWGARKGVVDSSLTETLHIDLSAKGDAVRVLSKPGGSQTEYAKQTLIRIFGNRDAWEGNPRLDGVTGSLPEYLPVER